MSRRGVTHRFLPLPRTRRAYSTATVTGAVVAGLLVLSPGQAQAAGTTYTVNNDPAAGCSDTAPTSSNGPFCTIKAAYAKAVNGDTISVSSGTYNERVDVAKTDITLVAPNGATVDGSGGLLYGIKVGAPDVVVDGFTFTNQTVSTSAAGVFVDGTTALGANNAVVRNVTATGSGGNGIRVTSGDGVTVTDVTVSGSARVGVLLQGATNSIVSSSETYENQREGVSIQGGSGDVVENVLTHNNANHTDLESDGVTFKRLAPGINVTNWQPPAGAALVAASNITVQRNVSYGNDDSGIQVYGGSRNITVRRNLTYDNGDHGIDISQASTGVNVVSNTVIGNFTAGINIESNADGSAGSQAAVRDNIAINNGNGTRTRGDIRVDQPSTTTGTTIDHDLVFDSAGGTLYQWGNLPNDPVTGAPGGANLFSSQESLWTATGQEQHGVQGDPKLDANNAPGVGSPAIDAADSTAPGWTSTDLYGHSPVDDPVVSDTGTGTPSYADLGAIEQTSVSKPANQPPTAALTASPSTITAGGTVTLDATGSSDPEHGTLTYAFNCGATGVTAAGTGSTATCTYPTAGSYTAKVTVTDDGGMSSTAQASVTVNAAPSGGGGGGTVNASPTASLTATPSTVSSGGTVTLDATGSKDTDGSIASWAFDCGNGSTARVGQTSGTASCTYQTAGSFTARVTVTDNQGATGSADAVITVNSGAPRPTAALVGGRVRQGEPIRIDARGSHANGDATIVSYTFRCAGHVIGPRQRARAACVFRHRGIHRVWVKVTDSNGLTDRAMARVRVVRGRAPVARLALSADTIPVGRSVLAFAGRSHGSRWSAIKDVRFVCGNGQRSHWRESTTYRCRFDQAGRYRVTVVVRNTLGLRARASDVVRVRRG